MPCYTVTLTIPDLDAEFPRDAATMFLMALRSADWSDGLGFDIKDEPDPEYLRPWEIEKAIAATPLEAAAPDMLAALKALKAEIDGLKWGQKFPGRPHKIMDAAIAAIAKAEGRTNG